MKREKINKEWNKNNGTFAHFTLMRIDHHQSIGHSKYAHPYIFSVNFKQKNIFKCYERL